MATRVAEFQHNRPQVKTRIRLAPEYTPHQFAVGPVRKRLKPSKFHMPNFPGAPGLIPGFPCWIHGFHTIRSGMIYNPTGKSFPSPVMEKSGGRS